MAVKSSWSKVKHRTISNCFRKCDFVYDGLPVEGEEIQHDFPNLWERLAETFGEESIPSFNEYVEVDANDDSVTETLTDLEIVYQIQTNGQEEVEENMEIIENDDSVTETLTDLEIVYQIQTNGQEEVEENMEIIENDDSVTETLTDLEIVYQIQSNGQEEVEENMEIIENDDTLALKPTNRSRR